MSRHIDPQIADLLAGRLDESSRQEAEAHVKQCEDCAQQLAWARTLREDAMAQGLRHLPPERIVELSARPDGTTEAERAHLDDCSSCRGELDWAAKLPGETVAVVTPQPRRWLWPAGLAAAVLALALVLLPLRTGSDPSALALVEPLPVRITRDAPAPGSFEESRMLGLEAYQSGDWAAAREHFNSALSLQRNQAELLLYLGSAELLIGRRAEAATHLEQARQPGALASIVDEAGWQLAQVALLDGDAGRASRLLDTLADGDGHRADDARDLRNALEKASNPGQTSAN